MSSVPPAAPPATVPAPPPSASKRAREGIRDHLTPANTVIGLGGTALALADLLAPVLAPAATVLRNSAMVVTGCIIVAAAWPGPFDRLLGLLGWQPPDPKASPAGRRPWHLHLRRWIVPAVIAALALHASLSAAGEGGVIASRMPSLRDLQRDLLGLRDDVRAMRQDVAQTRDIATAIEAREQALQARMAHDPLSVGLLVLNGDGRATGRGAAWPVRLAVHVNEAGHDLGRARLVLSHGTAADAPAAARLQPVLGSGTTPSDVQTVLQLPAATRWVSACLVLPDGTAADRRALLHRWQADPTAEGLRLQPDGPPRLLPTDDPACDDTHASSALSRRP